jgi:alpha-galactosidase
MPVHTTAAGWTLETRRTAYALGLNSAGLLVHRYWGPRLPEIHDYPPPADSIGWASFNGPGQVLPEEFPVYGGLRYVEPCLKATFADGVRDVVLTFREAQVEGETLTLTLVDAHYPLSVRLIYRVHVEFDLIERWAEFSNTGEQPIVLERALSACWHVPPGTDYRLTHLTGRWYDEMRLQRDPLPRGVTALESRRLTTSHHHNPFFMLDRGASETAGEVYFGALAWSGNWKLLAEVTDFDSTRVALGLNDWDFAWTLDGGAAFTTPPALAGFTEAGFGGASRLLHDHIRERVLPHGPIVHPVLYNSWEATYFDVDVESQMRLADLAASLGVELFVVDDGWFHRRRDDRAGLGDWWPDAAKFPHGLGPLIEHVNRLGMDFGLWLEPEMVSPDSELYRAHPDWVIHFPTRPRTEARNQLILNLAREEVRAYLLERIDALLSAHPIRFIKWDMNRNISEPGWPEAGARQRELWVRYVEGVYALWGELRRRHPAVIWQSCSGGGGRADLGILRFADQIWVSDNTEAPARLAIQEGFSYLFPASVMEAWVTDSGDRHVPLRFRFHVSMAGALGIGGNLLTWTEAQRAEAARLIAQYKALRPIIQLGDQYRLISPRAGGFSAVQYVSKDRAASVVFAFRTHLPTPAILPRLHPQGLEPEARYRLEGTDAIRSGLGWMRVGLEVALTDFDSALLVLRRVE